MRQIAISGTGQHLRPVVLGIARIWVAGRGIHGLGFKWSEQVYRRAHFRAPATGRSPVAMVMLVGVAANYLPARRAARVNPVMILRDE